MKRKMLNLLILNILIAFIFSSCAMPSYKHTYESQKGLDLRKGKWLVNHIESDLSLQRQNALAKQLMKKLNKLGDISVVYIDSVNLHYLIPSQLEFDLSPETLSVLSGTTDFDFIVNVKATQVSSEMGSLMLPYSSKYKNQSEVYIDVYEIASGERVYSQRIVATIGGRVDDGEVYLTKSSSRLIFGALNKGIKEIRKYSIRK